MRRALLAGPIAVFATGCALRPWTPSTSVAYWPEEPPALPSFVVPAQGDAMAMWQLPPTSPWARYEKLTLLASLDVIPRSAIMPDIAALEVVNDAQRAALAVAAAGLPADTMWVVDLRGAASVAFGAALSRRAREHVAPVLTFNNWPAENELIPAEETLAALLLLTPRLPDPNDLTARPVFLLDAWRLAYRYDEPDDGVTDNRYILNPSDLPSAAELRAHGIRRVMYLVEDLDDTDQEEDDLHATFLEYQRAGITIVMVDLALLTKDLAAPAAWPVMTSRCTYVVHYRHTLIEDPVFYARARGGFGGLHLGPSPFRGGGFGGHGGPVGFGGG